MKLLRRLLLAITSVIGAWLFAQTGSALADEPLAVAHIENLITGRPGAWTSVNYQIGYSTGMYTPLAFPLFDQYMLTIDDVGRTFTATAATDPDFDGFVGYLTDGVARGVGLLDSQGGTLVRTEPTFFTELPAGGNGIDLYGFQIGTISLYVDALTLNSAGDGSWTDIYFRGTISVSAIPEPAPIALGALGALGLGLRRRWLI